MKYNQTAEYAFDLTEHQYFSLCHYIAKIGKDRFKVLIPNKLKENLKSVRGDFPVTYRGITIEYADVDIPLFALKEV